MLNKIGTLCIIGRMKYRVTLSSTGGLSPYLHMLRFGKVSHSQWILPDEGGVMKQGVIQ